MTINVACINLINKENLQNQSINLSEQSGNYGSLMLISPLRLL